jgi:hypothetical protein
VRMTSEKKSAAHYFEKTAVFDYLLTSRSSLLTSAACSPRPKIEQTKPRIVERRNSKPTLCDPISRANGATRLKPTGLCRFASALRPSMKNLLVCCLCMATISSVSAEDSVPKLIPLQDFFRNPTNTFYQLSPGGHYIAYLAPVDQRLNLWVRSRDKNDDQQLTAVKDRDLTTYFWKTDRFLLYVKDNGGDENFHLYSVDRETKAVRDLTPFPKVQARLLDDLEDDPTDVIVTMNRRNPEVSSCHNY